jgi:hypothetical protein
VGAEPVVVQVVTVGLHQRDPGSACDLHHQIDAIFLRTVRSYGVFPSMCRYLIGASVKITTTQYGKRTDVPSDTASTRYKHRSAPSSTL